MTKLFSNEKKINFPHSIHSHYTTEVKVYNDANSIEHYIFYCFHFWVHQWRLMNSSILYMEPISFKTTSFDF